MGKKIIQLLPNGGDVALFIATPGSANIQLRIDVAKRNLDFFTRWVAQP